MQPAWQVRRMLKSIGGRIKVKANIRKRSTVTTESKNSLIANITTKKLIRQRRAVMNLSNLSVILSSRCLPMPTESSTRVSKTMSTTFSMKLGTLSGFGVSDESNMNLKKDDIAP